MPFLFVIQSDCTLSDCSRIFAETWGKISSFHKYESGTVVRKHTNSFKNNVKTLPIDVAFVCWGGELFNKFRSNTSTTSLYRIWVAVQAKKQLLQW